MTKLLVLYYSMYGHIERLAQAVAEGANRVNDVDVTIKRVPETMTPEAFAKAGGNQHQQPPDLDHAGAPRFHHRTDRLCDAGAV